MSASRTLPPSQRDFDIYHAIQITGATTRRVAELNDLSQTRVRQIVAHVVEWIAEVLPPEADITKEKRAQLARHIAADRLQYQLEEASEHWSRTSAPKYMNLLTRITVANARLGVVSGTIDALAADALEGLPVPAWQPPVVLPESPDPVSAEPADDPSPQIQNPKSPIPNSRRPINAGQAELLNNFRNIWPRTERVRLAVELEEALQLLPPEHREAIRASEAQRLSPEQLALEAAVRAGQIPGDDAFLIDPASYSPPVGDCSTKNDSADVMTERSDESLDPSWSYDTPNEAKAAQITPSAPLLTSSPPQPVTALHITPDQPGISVTSPAPTQQEHQTSSTLPTTLHSS